MYSTTVVLYHRHVHEPRLFMYSSTVHVHQGINEGDFYTFEGLFQLEQEGSRRCNTINVQYNCSTCTVLL